MEKKIYKPESCLKCCVWKTEYNKGFCTFDKKNKVALNDIMAIDEIWANCPIGWDKKE